MTGNASWIAAMEPLIKSLFKCKEMKRSFFCLLFLIGFFNLPINLRTLKAENLNIINPVPHENPIPTGFTGQVIYVSEMNDTLLFVKSENIPAEIFISVFNSTEKKWANPVQITFLTEIAKDDYQIYGSTKELFVSLKNKKGTLDLYSFTYVKGKCFNLNKMSDNINTCYNEKNACLSEDHNTIYFSSDRNGGKGGYDIYKSEKLENGEWGKPQNLGAEINSKSDEDTPYILSDNVTLYFSSKAHGSIGGYDIFNSTLSEEGIWSKPESEGISVNSKGDEKFYYLTADEKIFFYSSSANNALQKELSIFEFVNYNPEYSIKNQ